MAIRDGAFSRFDCSSAVEGFMPVQGLKSFLMQYVDEKAVEAQRHASTADDDNPPSPVGMDSLDTLLSSQVRIYLDENCLSMFLMMLFRVSPD